MYSDKNAHGMTRGGFPHSDIPGSKLVDSSPRLIAVFHVLLRYYMSRHPLSALEYLFMHWSTSSWQKPKQQNPEVRFWMNRIKLQEHFALLVTLQPEIWYLYFRCVSNPTAVVLHHQSKLLIYKLFVSRTSRGLSPGTQVQAMAEITCLLLSELKCYRMVSSHR